MIETDKRKAIFLLHQEGMPLREISRRLCVGRNSIRRVIRQQGAMPQCIRADKQRIDPQLLRSLHHDCQGRIQRMHEKLTEEEGIQVSYPTLTRMLRELEIGKPAKSRCDRVHCGQTNDRKRRACARCSRSDFQSHQSALKLLFSNKTTSTSHQSKSCFRGPK